MEFKRLTITLEPQEGLVTFNAFKVALEELTIMLREIESEVSESRRSQLKWGIAELSLGSATVGLENLSEEVDLAQRTATTLIKGLKVLAREKTRPDYFNDTALESARKLAKLSDDGISRINVYSNIPELQLYFTEQIAVNVRDILEHLEYLGSVEGLLELISGREGLPLYFQIKDIVSGNLVRCFFPEEMLGNALGAFRKRVIVSGYIQSDSSGNPRRIRVRDMEIAPKTENLPQPTDLIKGIEGYRFKEQFYDLGKTET